MTAELDVEDGVISVIIKRKLAPLIQVEVEPVGKWFHAYEARRLKGLQGISCGDDTSDESEDDDENHPEVEIEDDIQFLRSLNPAEWKDQDHYAVLGLKKYRYKCSDDDIKKAYRVMVLRHHPDKRRGAGEEIREDDDYFTNITKAYEILGVPTKRRAYDSVDPDFDDDVPAPNQKKSKFFEVFGPVFERNARWSLRKHVPGLGKENDLKPKVEKFYNFWYNFESWREFSYLDEEDKEKGQDRDERRWIEKQNKAERARRRKEEMARLRRLVDNAYGCDPRIIRFKEEEKEKRLAQKKARQDAIRQRIEEEERVKREAEEAERKKKEAEEAELKAKQEAEKKERDIIKKALKKERKGLRTICKDNEYYTTNADERVQIMTDVELLCEALQATKLESLNTQLKNAAKDIVKGREVLLEQIGHVKAQIQREKEEGVAAISKSGSGASSEKSGGKSWNPDDLQLLIKAVNVFPAGTNKRWEVVAEYINQHSTSGINRQAKEVLNKAKELQHSDQHMKEAANKNAYSALEKAANTLAAPISDAGVSQRLETPQEMLGMNNQPWSADEQQLLEQALKTYPASTEDRWDKIAECIPDRSKKDCMRRYKELVEMVKAKKKAQKAAEKR